MVRHIFSIDERNYDTFVLGSEVEPDIFHDPMTGDTEIIRNGHVRHYFEFKKFTLDEDIRLYLTKEQLSDIAHHILRRIGEETDETN